MKSQGLPMTTIILIILAIITLAVVLIFFFTKFRTGEQTTNEQQMFVKCNSACAKIKYLKANEVFANAKGVFCQVSYDCSQYVDCEVPSIKSSDGIICHLKCYTDSNDARCEYP